MFDDLIADMKSKKKLSPNVTELFLRARKLNISLSFTSQSYLKVPKTIRLNATHYFIMEIPNKRELQQKASNHLSNTDFKDFGKLYKDYAKEPYSFLMNDTTLSSDNPLRFRKRLIIKMSISEKIKAINNKIRKKKAQYNLQRQTATISALSSANVSKHEILTGKDVLSEKDLLEKAATMKRFEYSRLGKELNT